MIFEKTKIRKLGNNRSAAEFEGGKWRCADYSRNKMMNNSAQDLANQYLRLGGHRLLVMDDNILSTKSWEADPPEAETFWKREIEILPPRRRNEVMSFLPSINVS